MFAPQRTLEREKYCPHCRRYVLAREKQFPAAEHIAGVILTCGLWFPVMLFLMFITVGKYLCPRCGASCRRRQ